MNGRDGFADGRMMSPAKIARNVSTAAVATIAAWSSWSHMVHVALRFGERPEVAYVLPISVDGMLIVASTAMVEDKRVGRSVRWSARVAFTAGVAASVAANIAAAHPSVGARIVAAWPAIAMLLVVEMLSRARPQATPSEPGPSGAVTDDAPHGRPLGAPTGRATADESADSNLRRPARKRARAAGPKRRATAELVTRLVAERPDGSLADIAAAVGVSERHVRRLLQARAPTVGGGGDRIPR